MNSTFHKNTILELNMEICLTMGSLVRRYFYLPLGHEEHHNVNTGTIATCPHMQARDPPPRPRFWNEAFIPQWLQVSPADSLQLPTLFWKCTSWEEPLGVKVLASSWRRLHSSKMQKILWKWREREGWTEMTLVHGQPHWQWLGGGYFEIMT